MQGKLRKALLVLVFMGLVAAAAPTVSAQYLHHVNPYNYAAGIREIGLYTMVVPGIGRGHLWPLPSLVPGTNPPLTGNGVTAQSAGTLAALTAPTAPVMSIGATARSSPAQQPLSHQQTTGLAKGAGALETPMGGFVSGASEEGQVDHLESGLRDLINKLGS